ncbi:MAG: DUF4276 family protein [Verrucomicrobiota bacterium]
MGFLVPIVEGDGEIEAVPVLLRRLLEVRQRWDLQIARPKNAHGCGNLTKVGGLEKFAELAFRERECAGVLILMDADEEQDCPMQMAQRFVQRIQNYGARFPVAIVFARREYEAWFLASLETIAGQDIGGRPGLPANLVFDGDVENVRSVKGWLSRNLPGNRIYKETEDQAPMTERIDFLRAADRSRSFRRFCKALDDLIDAIDSSQIRVTP